jgi:hypothetical protein
VGRQGQISLFKRTIVSISLPKSSGLSFLICCLATNGRHKFAPSPYYHPGMNIASECRQMIQNSTYLHSQRVDVSALRIPRALAQRGWLDALVRAPPEAASSLR